VTRWRFPLPNDGSPTTIPDVVAWADRRKASAIERAIIWLMVYRHEELERTLALVAGADARLKSPLEAAQR